MRRFQFKSIRTKMTFWFFIIGAATLINDLGMRHLKIRFKNPVAAARWATVLFALLAVILGAVGGLLAAWIRGKAWAKIK